MSPIHSGISPNNLKKLITPAMIKAAESVWVAEDHLSAVKPIVEYYQREILAKHHFTMKAEYWKQEGVDKSSCRITEHKKSFLMRDEDFEAYDRECKIARDRSGLEVDHPDSCPLLVAQNKLVQAKRQFIDAIAPLSGFNMKSPGIWKDNNFEKTVQIFTGLFFNMGLINKPLQAAKTNLAENVLVGTQVSRSL